MALNEYAEIMKKRVRGVMPRVDLEKRIREFLSQQSMCILSTCSQDRPRATPVEYYNDGLETIYINADPGVKMDNIKVNPRVCIGIINNVKPDWRSGPQWIALRTAQISGNVTVLRDGSPGIERADQIYKWQAFCEATGMDASKPSPYRAYIVIKPIRIEYVEFALKKFGYGSKQIWNADGTIEESAKTWIW
jgi:hypothetical protein